MPLPTKTCGVCAAPFQSYSPAARTCSRACFYASRRPPCGQERMADGTVRIPLSQGLFAVIDGQDEDRVCIGKWTAARVGSSDCFYAFRKVAGRIVLMHRLVMGSPDSEVDHIDRDGLNNRRSNLRPCTTAQNAANRRKPISGKSSRFKGVSRRKEPGAKWRMSCAHQVEREFDTEEAAARAYDEAARRIYGPFARVNFPEGA